MMADISSDQHVDDSASASASSVAGGGNDEQEPPTGTKQKHKPIAPAAPESNSKEQTDKDEETHARNEAAFECNICLDVASDAVISMCGHLFCWPCLHQWLEMRPLRQQCPVCKAGIGRDKVVPLYGRGNPNQKDPRDKPIPPRPRGQRPEPDSNSSGHNGRTGFWGFGGGHGGFQMSFGIGTFPFGLYTANFNFGDVPPPGSVQYEEEQLLHKVFVWVAIAFIVWLFMA